MLNIDNITGVSFSDFMVDEFKITLAIREFLKSKFSSFEEVKAYYKSLTYDRIYLYSKETGFVTILL